MEGLKIYSRLKKAIPQIGLSALYEPMLKALQNGNGHPYSKVFSKEGQKVWKSNHQEIQGLIELCTNKGIDQEWVSSKEIRELSKFGLNKDNIGSYMER